MCVRETCLDWCHPRGQEVWNDEDCACGCCRGCVDFVVKTKKACQANTDLMFSRPSACRRISLASRSSGLPAGMAMQIHVCTSVSSRSSREVCRACSALNSAALVSWMKSEDLEVISLFARSCVAQLQPSSSSRSRAPRWTVGQAPTSTSIEGNRILPAIASSGQSGERRKDHVLFSVRPGGRGVWLKGGG